jgi:hypothetical protein
MMIISLSGPDLRAGATIGEKTVVDLRLRRHAGE